MDGVQLAVKDEVWRRVHRNWLKGPGRPSKRKIERIAEITGVDPAWLVGDAAERAPEGLDVRPSRCTAQTRLAA